MKAPVWPKAKLGIAACSLSAGFIVLLFLRYCADIPLPKSIIGVEGAAGLLAGVVSYIKNDRGGVIILSLAVGLASIFWAIVELYFPY